MSFLEKIDTAVHNSFVGRFFEFEPRKAKFSIELKGALATFMTMSYILAVNPRIIADTGGPCVPDPQDMGGIFGLNYSLCIEEIKREYVTSTAIASCIGCLFMGLGANLPIALAPGMGMNAYFAYSVVGFRGTGKVSYQAAVTAVAIEGAIFFLLAISGLRYRLIKLVPEPVRVATPAAIGAFLAHLGLQTGEGLGVVVSNIATSVSLGACPLESRVPIVAFTESCQNDTSTCVTSDGYVCESGVMSSATTWVGILGMMIILILLAYRWNSAFVVGISFVTFISWFRNTAITYFPHTTEGDARFEYFKQVVAIEPLNKVLVPFTHEISQVGVALFTFLYVDFLDTSGTLLGLVSNLGYVDEDGDFPRAKIAFASDALGTLVGSFFGLSPITAYVESAAGVGTGAKTGLTAVFCAFFFFLAIFFAPIIASVPAWATGGALIVVGSLMAKALRNIKWHDPTHAATAFLTVVLMPLTYSISYGLVGGILTYTVVNSAFWVLSKFGIEKPVFEPEPDDTYPPKPKPKLIEDDAEKPIGDEEKPKDEEQGSSEEIPVENAQSEEA